MYRSICYTVGLMLVVIGVVLALRGEFYFGNTIALVGALAVFVCEREKR